MARRRTVGRRPRLRRAGRLAQVRLDGRRQGGLESTSRYLARDLGPEGVRVNLVAAGPIRTMAAKSIPGLRRLRERLEHPGAARLGPRRPRAGREGVRRAAVRLVPQDHRRDRPRRRRGPRHRRLTPPGWHDGTVGDPSHPSGGQRRLVVLTAREVGLAAGGARRRAAALAVGAAGTRRPPGLGWPTTTSCPTPSSARRRLARGRPGPGWSRGSSPCEGRRPGPRPYYEDAIYEASVRRPTASCEASTTRRRPSCWSVTTPASTSSSSTSPTSPTRRPGSSRRRPTRRRASPS